jgi:beta-phosphoglucomutase-like phosphatase (HAD superfamily)
MISFKNKKVIVFDLDGTIVKLAVDWGYIKRKMSERYSKIYGEKCEFKHISGCLDYVVEKNDERELKNFFKILEDYELKNINNNKKIEETIFFINHLNLFNVPKDAKLAIFSLNTRKTIIKSLKLAKIYDKFDYIVGREDIRKWKPNPDGLQKIKEYFGVSNKDMIYFGDLQKDIQTGNNAGVQSHLIEEIIEIVQKKKQQRAIS